MKNKKIINMLIILVALISVVYAFQKTYAKYIKKINTSMETNVAIWNIKINEEDVLNKNTLENKIVPIFPGNEYVNPGVIAPGVTGYFDLSIDPNGTQVAFSYQITAGINEEIPDIKIIGYTIDPDNNEDITTYDENNPTIGEILVGDNLEKVRVYIKWLEEGTLDNKSDTEKSTLEKIEYEINLKLTQIIN